MSSGRSRGAGGGGGSESAHQGAPDDPSNLFQRLEQADSEEAYHIKEILRENLRTLAGEAWLLNGLIDYYVNTGSSRCLDVLLSCAEGNSRTLIERLHQLLKSADQRGAGLRLLGYYVRKHPVWLRKIVTQTNPSIVKDLFRIIKSECEVQCIISAALVLTTLMPMFPVALIDHIQELFQVLSRLTAMVSAPGSHLGRSYQLHLHVATYSYFVRVYAMYPCNLLSFLRQHYGQRDNLPLFNRTIRPLFDHVRMHPLLVTGSNSTETAPQRWQKKETHDIVAECSHFSLDVLEASPMDNLAGPLWGLATRDTAGADSLGSTDVGLDSADGLDIHDILWSPATFSSLMRHPAADVLDGGAGSCETAVEATPDTTPAATPTVTPQRDLENPPLLRQSQPPSASCVSASRAVTMVTSTAKPRADSIPSSPLKKPPGNFRFGEAEMIHTIHHRIGQIVGERADDGVGVVSPVQFSEGAPSVTRPVPRASADAGGQSWSRAPPAAASGSGAPPTPGQTSSIWHEVADHSAEDLEVCDLTRQAAGVITSPGGSLTPFASTTAQLTQHPLRHLSASASASATIAAGQPTAIPGYRGADEDEDASPPPIGMAASVPQSRFDFDLVRHMTRYYSRHVLPVRQYRRTSSCPDLAAAGQADPAANNTGSMTTVCGPCVETTTQTEDTDHPAPYEHLLTVALPPPPQSPQVIPSPHRLLLEHGELTAPNGRLLSELLQYERYKREVHAHRNRRLFDRTRATGRLEEENRALKKQVQEMSVDVAECRRQLQLVKRQAARAGDEQRAAARRLQQRAAEDATALAQLSAQLAAQQHASADLSRQLAESDEQLSAARCQLLETSRDLECTRGKATRRAQLQARVLDLERRLLMVGQQQQQQQQRSCAADPAGGDRWAEVEVLASPAAAAAAAGDEGRRRAEAAISGLEEQVRERDLTIAELRRLLETVRVRHHEQLQALDERYAAVKEHLQSAETQLLLSPPPQPVSPPSPAHSNGSDPAAPSPGKHASADPGTADLRASVGADQ